MEDQNISVTKKEKTSKKRLKVLFKAIIAVLCIIVGFLSLPVFLIVPFLSREIDHTLAQWLWYPAFISIIAFYIYGLKSDNKKLQPQQKSNEQKNVKKKKMENLSSVLTAFWFTLIITFIFLNNYYSILPLKNLAVLTSVIVLFLISAIPVSLINEYVEKGSMSKDELFEFFKDRFYGIITGLLLILTLFAIYQQWIAYIFAFGGPLTVLLYWGLIHDFLSSKRITPFSRTFGIVSSIFSFCTVIGLTVYLLYLIPEDFQNLQNILITIIAAIFGGSMTLVGVAWTIRQGQKERADDRKQLEEDRKQEEIKKAKPIISFLDLKSIANEPILTCTFTGLPYVDRPETVSMKARFINSDNSNFKVAAFEIDGKRYPAEYTFYIVKNQTFYVRFNVSGKNRKYIIVLEDILGNQYSYQMEIKPVSKGRISGELFYNLIGFSEITEDNTP